jgi:hypothetical protein
VQQFHEHSGGPPGGPPPFRYGQALQTPIGYDHSILQDYANMVEQLNSAQSSLPAQQHRAAAFGFPQQYSGERKQGHRATVSNPAILPTTGKGLVTFDWVNNTFSSNNKVQIASLVDEQSTISSEAAATKVSSVLPGSKNPYQSSTEESEVALPKGGATGGSTC